MNYNIHLHRPDYHKRNIVMPSKDDILLAAKRLGFDAIGIEQSQEYCDIANARISA